jgi:hypothetical protein
MDQRLNAKIIANEIEYNLDSIEIGTEKKYITGDETYAAVKRVSFNIFSFATIDNKNNYFWHPSFKNIDVTGKNIILGSGYVSRKMSNKEYSTLVKSYKK